LVFKDIQNIAVVRKHNDGGRSNTMKNLVELLLIV
jgi:hypothetical protein